MEAVAIIPARWAATRFPGKVLAELAGRPLIQHVYERVKRAHRIADVVVAADDERIVRRVKQFGGRAVLTSPAHQSGTDRVAEAARDCAFPLVVNVQADEPLVRPEMLDALVESLAYGKDVPLASLMRRITDPAELLNPNVVKVVVDRNNSALYFSRSPVPNLSRWQEAGSDGTSAAGSRELPVFKHLGIYGFQRDFLFTFTRLAPGKLEQVERLEQLRALENGYRIKMIETVFDTCGVDTPADLAEAERRLKLEAAEKT